MVEDQEPQLAAALIPKSQRTSGSAYGLARPIIRTPPCKSAMTRAPISPHRSFALGGLRGVADHHREDHADQADG